MNWTEIKVPCIAPLYTRIYAADPPSSCLGMCVGVRVVRREIAVVTDDFVHRWGRFEPRNLPLCQGERGLAE